MILLALDDGMDSRRAEGFIAYGYTIYNDFCCRRHNRESAVEAAEWETLAADHAPQAAVILIGTNDQRFRL